MLFYAQIVADAEGSWWFFPFLSGRRPARMLSKSVIWSTFHDIFLTTRAMFGFVFGNLNEATLAQITSIHVI